MSTWNHMWITFNHPLIFPSWFQSFLFVWGLTAARLIMSSLCGLLFCNCLMRHQLFILMHPTSNICSSGWKRTLLSIYFCGFSGNSVKQNCAKCMMMMIMVTLLFSANIWLIGCKETIYADGELMVFWNNENILWHHRETNTLFWWCSCLQLWEMCTPLFKCM